MVLLAEVGGQGRSMDPLIGLKGLANLSWVGWAWAGPEAAWAGPEAAEAAEVAALPFLPSHPQPGFDPYPMC